mmetsp:Transcript_2423/g.4958  ORF Transcript_2423/g.4958 Transcript_2423/m.4958 type:complete len:227 (+) Transcript_2423:836-1516(+)
MDDTSGKQPPRAALPGRLPPPAQLSRGGVAGAQQLGLAPPGPPPRAAAVARVRAPPHRRGLAGLQGQRPDHARLQLRAVEPVPHAVGERGGERGGRGLQVDAGGEGLRGHLLHLPSVQHPLHGHGLHGGRGAGEHEKGRGALDVAGAQPGEPAAGEGGGGDRHGGPRLPEDAMAEPSVVPALPHHRGAPHGPGQPGRRRLEHGRDVRVPALVLRGGQAPGRGGPPC